MSRALSDLGGTVKALRPFVPAEQVTSLHLVARYGVKSPRAPKLQSWGLNVTYVTDPRGVLWHIAALPAESVA